MISHCLGQALHIAKHDRREWAPLVEKLPTECNHADCSVKNCQQVCKTWLRMQWRIQVQREIRK